MAKFDIHTIALLPFNDQNHLKHHLNYLFRTDPTQKWTNRYTDANLIIIGDTFSVIGKTLDERKHTAMTARNLIRKFNVNYSQLYMCCVECIDRYQHSYNDILVAEVMSIMRALDKELETEDLRILFAVTHEDQENLHFHIICSEFPVNQTK